MDLQEIICESCNADVIEFWKGMKIWWNNSHVVNRRILASAEVLTINVKYDITEIITNIQKLDILSYQVCNPEEDKINVTQLLDSLNITGEYRILHCSNPLDTHADTNDFTDDGESYLCIKKLVPRCPDLFSPTLEFILINKCMNYVTYMYKPLITNKHSLGPASIYNIYYNKGILHINVPKNLIDNAGATWLKEKLYPRLIKWMKSKSDNNLISGSLKHISPEKYATLYEKLKKKYGKEMVKIWPECTDPAKFVYEDIAIAAYLLSLWEKERQEKGIEQLQTFMDIGCGNGLLVYILSSEGHKGTGIDLRKRKIWDVFPKTTHLQVQSIVPSWNTVFPDVDWFIGNHSDELTPWIPVIAARSSYSSRFFLLPCCFYEFNGKRYKRDNAATSQYFEYINYVKTICEGCGFKTIIDRLKIPSTKRICLIGWERTYKKENTEAQNLCITSIINARSTITEVTNVQNTIESENIWSNDFKPRNPMEQVRNCTQLNTSLISDIVNIVTSNLLHEGRNITLDDRPGIWNAGRQMDISEIVKHVPVEMLKQLRNECGGLQTLLKNHSHIFEVVGGKVQFRIPGSTVNVRKRKNKSVLVTKTKPCWFHENHPDGCPTTDLKCNFKH